MVQGDCSSANNRYLLDADVLITASRHYYAMDISPGFWSCIEHFGTLGQVRSIDRVRHEIVSPPNLVQWTTRLGNRFFLFSGSEEVVSVFSSMQTWVYSNDQFMDAAKEEFATKADGWLAAYAKVHNYVLVTNEVSNPDSRKRVPLPDLCNKFEVVPRDPFQMLRDLGVSLNWSAMP